MSFWTAAVSHGLAELKRCALKRAPCVGDVSVDTMSGPRHCRRHFLCGKTLWARKVARSEGDECWLQNAREWNATCFSEVCTVLAATPAVVVAYVGEPGKNWRLC